MSIITKPYGVTKKELEAEIKKYTKKMNTPSPCSP